MGRPRRAGAVVGIAGGGGIGTALLDAMQLGFHHRVATMTLIVDLLVAATGWIGDAILRRLEPASLAALRR